jgi:hypothetical protein
MMLSSTFPKEAAVPALQIALRSSDIDLKVRVVVLAAFNLRRTMSRFQLTIFSKD